MSHTPRFHGGTIESRLRLFHKKRGGSALPVRLQSKEKKADVPRFACVSALPGRRRYRAASFSAMQGWANSWKEIGAVTASAPSRSTPLREVFWSML